MMAMGVRIAVLLPILSCGISFQKQKQPVIDENYLVPPLVCRPRPCSTEKIDSAVKLADRMRDVSFNANHHVVMRGSNLKVFSAAVEDGGNGNAGNRVEKTGETMTMSSASLHTKNNMTSSIEDHTLATEIARSKSDMEASVDQYPHCSDVYFDMLLRLKHFFNMNGIAFELFFGTLLGSIRDQELIPWELDFDIFLPRPPDKIKIMQLQSNPTIAADLKSKHHLVFGAEQQANPLGQIWLMRVCDWFEDNPEGVYVGQPDFPHGDVWVPPIGGKSAAPGLEKYWTESWRPRVTVDDPNLSDGIPLEPLGTCTVRGEEFPCPRNSTAMLRERYGEDWRIPDASQKGMWSNWRA